MPSLSAGFYFSYPSAVKPATARFANATAQQGHRALQHVLISADPDLASYQTQAKATNFLA
ncbi:MAG: hypothetical protein EBT36_13515 [Betaproteobacteria bacterium]|nr:hypothetical protein [Betaproteobacteria bacterium]NBO96159.1 hypothetical protein [Betaproteobacteria bacterium]NBP36784.1 hypothetical protein [Betaproteobacteria bacterium]NBQ79930.1 hypothetical protein [Betaproteobacteria bacterium]NBQ96408.1 hypothetical protein [Betaproteobacteria bacterium]